MLAKPVCNYQYHGWWLALGFAVLLGLFSGTDAWSAEPAADKAPQKIHFWADKTIIYTKDNRAVLSGRVKVQQGDNTATADQMTIIFSAADTTQSDVNLNSIEKIEFQDHVRIEFDDNVAVGQKAVYFSAQRKLVLSGPGTKITSGQNELSCSTATYFRNEGRMECTSDGNGQVKATVHSSGTGLN